MPRSPIACVAVGTLASLRARTRLAYASIPPHTPEELLSLIPAFHRAGWTVATHAIGDRAIDHALNGIEAALTSSQRPARHRIEHFAIATDTQVARSASLGVIPVPQGVFISEFGDGILEAISPERSAGTYRMRSLLDAGMIVPGSTDSPVSDANSFVSMHDLVNRKTSSGADFAPMEKVTAVEALRAYTFGSAYAAGYEDQVGTLEVGKLADFAALNEDVLTDDPASIRDIRPTATVIGGELLFGEA